MSKQYVLFPLPHQSAIILFNKKSASVQCHIRFWHQRHAMAFLAQSDKNYREISTISQVGDTKGDDGEVYQNGGPEWKCSHPVNPLSCSNVLQYLLAEV
jgi:hypothetical protein